MSPEIHAQPTSRQHLWGPLAPWLVFVVATWPLRAWIVDDAAISFAYAHNFATGHGLTSQPGVTAPLTMWSDGPALRPRPNGPTMGNARKPSSSAPGNMAQADVFRSPAAAPSRAA